LCIWIHSVVGFHISYYTMLMHFIILKTCWAFHSTCNWIHNMVGLHVLFWSEIQPIIFVIKTKINIFKKWTFYLDWQNIDVESRFSWRFTSKLSFKFMFKDGFRKHCHGKSTFKDDFPIFENIVQSLSSDIFEDVFNNCVPKETFHNSFKLLLKAFNF